MMMLSASGGVLLFIADYPVQWPWLQLIAFAPLLWAVLGAPSALGACAYGASWALGRVIPLAFAIGSFALPWWARAALLMYLLALELLFALLVFRVRTTRTWLFAFLVAATFVAIEAVDSWLPLWGTARTLARAWSLIPGARGLIRWGGTYAVSFVVVCTQALVVVAARRRERWAIPAALTGLALAAGISSVASRPTVGGTLEVAAVGWGGSSDARNADARVHQAALGGARLVVFPEVAFEIFPGGRPAMEAHWSRLAHDNHLWLVIPFRDRDRAGNRAAVFDSTGLKLGEYAKHHLVPLAESYPPGDGTLLTFTVDGVRIGVAICQDDNFRDVARAYARRGVQLLVVPTLEGPPEVAPYHFRNSVLRTIENPMALVRATAGGQSAVIAPGGEIVASFDHARKGSGLLLAKVPVAALPVASGQ